MLHILFIIAVLISSSFSIPCNEETRNFLKCRTIKFTETKVVDVIYENKKNGSEEDIHNDATVIFNLKEIENVILDLSKVNAKTISLEKLESCKNSEIRIINNRKVNMLLLDGLKENCLIETKNSLSLHRISKIMERCAPYCEFNDAFRCKGGYVDNSVNERLIGCKEIFNGIEIKTGEDVRNLTKTISFVHQLHGQFIFTDDKTVEQINLPFLTYISSEYCPAVILRNLSAVSSIILNHELVIQCPGQPKVVIEGLPKLKNLHPSARSLLYQYGVKNQELTEDHKVFHTLIWFLLFLAGLEIIAKCFS